MNDANVIREALRTARWSPETDAEIRGGADAAIESLVAERDEANDDRDNWKAACDGWQMAAEGAKENREAAEARVQQLKAALETIWRMHDIPIGGESYSAAMRETARAALADVKEEE